MVIYQIVILLFTLVIQQFAYASPPLNESTFLIISDVHLDPVTSHEMEFSPAGRNHLNDLQKTMFEVLIAKIASDIKQGLIPRPKFMIYLGDIVGHNRSTSEFATVSESLFFNYIVQQFPDTPILYTFGNNDSVQQNYGSFSSVAKNNGIITPLTIAFDTHRWGHDFLSTGVVCQFSSNRFPCIIDENTEDGYYSAYLESGLRLITLNSIMFSRITADGTNENVATQLTWLNRQLDEARYRHESVLLTMHIPPGANVYNGVQFWSSTTTAAFLKLVDAYQGQIIGILTGHTHTDEITVIQDASHKNLMGIFSIPALSTSHGNSPSFRVFSYSRDNAAWRLTNYESYYFTKHDDVVQISKLYDFKNYYCNSQQNNMLSCLSNLTIDKMERFYLSGNEKFQDKIAHPEALILTITDK